MSAVGPSLAPEPRLRRALDRLRSELPAALAGRALDVAAGNGRHSLLLARSRIPVDALDRDALALARLELSAQAEQLPIRCQVVDLEAKDFDLPRAAWSLIAVVNYLHRPLFPILAAALSPGGALYYETFTTGQPAFGKPTNPDFLLEPGELRREFSTLEELSYEEGIFDGVAARAMRLASKPQR